MYTFARNTQYLAPKWRAYVTPYSSGFRFANGLVVASLWELKQALLTLEESVIMSHLTDGVNHIALWVEHVIGDIELAEQLKNSDQRWSMVVALERHMMRTLNLPDYVARRWMARAQSSFRFSSGEEIWSLEDLERILSTIPDEVLAFHYQRFPNDLSVWLADIVGDYYLADSLEESNNKDQIVLIVQDHLEMLRDALS